MERADMGSTTIDLVWGHGSEEGMAARDLGGGDVGSGDTEGENRGGRWRFRGRRRLEKRAIRDSGGGRFLGRLLAMAKPSLISK